MHNGRHIPIDRVLYRAMRHPNAEDLTGEMAAEYTFELIRRLGIPLSFGEFPRYATFKNYRVAIPKDLIYIRGIRFHASAVEVEVNVENDVKELEFYEKLDIQLNGNVNWLPVKYTGNIYQSSYHCEDYLDNTCKTDITYTINNNYIFLSEPKGAIEISYRGLILDENGYPMIPDNQAFEDALYYYILKEHFLPLVGVGKITQYFYEKIEQEYAWAVGQAETSLKLASVDHWETTMNGIRRLIQYQNFSDYGYDELHRREQIKKSF